MICPCILIDYYYAMRSVVRRSSNNHMRTLVDTSRQFCSASPVKSIDIQLTLPWTLGGQQSLRLDHSQSLTSTLVNFKYTPMAKHGDGQKEMTCPEFCEYSQWLLSIANAPCLAKVLQHHTGVFQFVSSLLFLFVKLLQPLLKRDYASSPHFCWPTRHPAASAPCPNWRLSRLLELQTPSGWLDLPELKLGVASLWLSHFPKDFENFWDVPWSKHSIFMYIHVYSCIFMYIHVYSCIFMYIHNVYWVWSSIAVPGICPSLTMAQRCLDLEVSVNCLGTSCCFMPFSRLLVEH